VLALCVPDNMDPRRHNEVGVVVFAQLLSDFVGAVSHQRTSWLGTSSFSVDRSPSNDF
jgi:hypothetical protein